MATVTFPPALGGDGSTVTDDANPSTGLANGGHRTRFVPALAQTVAVLTSGVDSAQDASDSADAAAASAASALLAPGVSATSTTSLSVGSGSKSLTLAQTGKTFVVGQFVVVTRTANPNLNWMLGAITAFNSGTGAMTVSVTATQGSGTYSAWTVTAAAPIETRANLTPPTVVSGTSVVAVAGGNYVLTNSGGVTTLTLPTSPLAGDVVRFDNATGRNDVIISRSAQLIMNLPEDIDPWDLAGSYILMFMSPSLGWRFV